jgi:DNA repair exonuclease SbcCD ATPase subunit
VLIHLIKEKRNSFITLEEINIMQPQLYKIAEQQTKYQNELKALQNYLKNVNSIGTNPYYLKRKEKLIKSNLAELDLAADKIFCPWFFKL